MDITTVVVVLGCVLLGYVLGYAAGVGPNKEG